MTDQQWHDLVEESNQRRHREVMTKLDNLRERHSDHEARIVAIEKVCGQRQRRASSEARRASVDNARRDRAVDDLRGDMRTMREELRDEIREVRGDVREELQAFRAEQLQAESQFREHETTGVREMSERSGAVAERRRLFAIVAKVAGIAGALGGAGALTYLVQYCGG